MNKYQKQRVDWIQEGKEIAKNCSPKFSAGISLFWAEGSKKRNTVAFANSDPDMMKFFLDFLREHFHLDEDKIRFCFQWYSNNSLTFEDVKDFWSAKLDIKKENWVKCFIDVRQNTKGKNKKKDKLKYGVGRLQINSTELVSKLYGAIQEFFKIERKQWETLPR